ncbi:hypothetical protein EDD86DRAFT_205433 [Gorgonomyces haynaldii]|nr:hypothetical protein EDD86DRAFT_205433 [Gorgonomyces haynaldii]
MDHLAQITAQNLFLMLSILINTALAAPPVLIAMPKYCSGVEKQQQLQYSGYIPFTIALGFSQDSYNQQLSAVLRASPSAFFASRIADGVTARDKNGATVNTNLNLQFKGCSANGLIPNTQSIYSTTYDFDYQGTYFGDQVTIASISVEIAWDSKNVTNSQVASCYGNTPFAACY